MLTDTFTPVALDLPETTAQHHGVAWRSTCWTQASLAGLAARLAVSGPCVVSSEDRLAAWVATVEEFRDPTSASRRALEEPLAHLCRLSPAGLSAGLEAVLGGVAEHSAVELFDAARMTSDGLVVVVLASNVPALVVQPLLPALALGCPVLVKSASAEPLFAPAFVNELCRREPRLRAGLAAVTWQGGDRTIEDGVFEHASRVIAYGGGEAMASLSSRTGSRLITYGPKISLALADADTDPLSIASGLARDIALFDQRGCLSVQAIYTAGDAERLADALAPALVDRARVWPPGKIDVHLAAAVRQLRDEATMRGLLVADLELHQGTVVVEPQPGLAASPGLRTVRIHPVADLGAVPPLLRGWKGRLQGAALAGAGAWETAPALRAIGFSHLASPGELQTPTASWHNGGISPLHALGQL